MVNSGYFDIPFGQSGDLTPVPDPVQGSGAVSYTEGFGVLYQTPVASGGLNIPRGSMNQLFNDITTAIQLQQQGLPAPFITSAMNNGSPYSYAQYATVVRSGVAYTSNVGSNTTTPPSSSWTQLVLGNGLPVNIITGTGHNFVTGDASTFITRSNSGTNMVDTLPGTSGALANGWFAYVKNTDSAATETITVGGGGSIHYGNVTGNVIINPGQTLFIQSQGSGVYNVSPLGSALYVQNTISGLLPTSISGSSTSAAVTISSGLASDSSGSVLMNGAGYSWLVSNGNAINGYSGGTTLPNSSTIHFYLCQGSSGLGVYAIPNSSYPLAASSAPTGYTSYVRRIFSINTDSSGNPIPYIPTEAEGGSLINWLVTQLLDVSTTLSATASLFSLTVPSGIKVEPIGRYAGAANSSNWLIVTSGDETDVAPNTGGSLGFTAAPGWDIENNGASIYSAGSIGVLTTNTSGQIRARANTSSVPFQWVTRGFKDFRRN